MLIRKSAAGVLRFWKRNCIMYDHALFSACKSPEQTYIRPHVKWAVNLVNASGHINLPKEFVRGYEWVNMLTLSPTPKGST